MFTYSVKYPQIPMRWINITFDTDIHGPQRMDPHNIGDPLNYYFLQIIIIIIIIIIINYRMDCHESSDVHRR